MAEHFGMERLRSLAIVPHVSSALSVMGSGYIVTDTIRRKKLSSAHHRLLLGMSTVDFVVSAFWFLSTWPIPANTLGVWGAAGTTATCSLQGFFLQFGVATPLYNASLSVHSLLQVRYNVKKKKLRQVEVFMHAFALSMGLITAILCLALQLFNSANVWCWIAPMPMDCINSAHNEGGTTCVRGDNAWIFRLAFWYIWVWLSLVVVTVAMGLLYWTVHQQVHSMTAYQEGGTKSIRKKKKQVAIQAVLYILAFYLTAIFPTIVRMTQAKWNCTHIYYPLSLLTTFFSPLHGFWNFFIYIHPRCAKYMKKHPNWCVPKLPYRTAYRSTKGEQICYGDDRQCNATIAIEKDSSQGLAS